MQFGTQRKAVQELKEGKGAHTIAPSVRVALIAGTLDIFFLEKGAVCDVLHTEIIDKVVLMDNWPMNDAKKTIDFLVKKGYFKKSEAWLIATQKWLDRYD